MLPCDPGRAIPATDEAVRAGSVALVGQLLTDAMKHPLHAAFAQVMSSRTFRADDLVAGRGYVKAYVEFIRFVERLAGAPRFREPTRNGTR